MLEFFHEDWRLMDKQELNEQIAIFVNNIVGGICLIKINTNTYNYRFEFINDGFSRMLGISKKETEMLLNNADKAILPEDLDKVKYGIRDILADNGSIEFEFRYVTMQGGLAWMRLRGNLFDRKGSESTIACIVLDCTDEKNVENELKTQNELMNTLIDSTISFDFNVRTDVCVIKLNTDKHIQKEYIVDKYLENVDSSGIHPEDRKLFVDTIKSAMKRVGKDSFEYRAVPFQTDSEDYKWYKCNVMSVAGQDGYITHILGLVSDINTKKIEELELKLKADKDPLTQLLNKGATEEFIRNILVNIRKKKKIGALIMMDVDDFKNINDSFGHSVGDNVLAYVGKILSQNFKGKDVVGRVGGDEFMIFMYDISDKQDPEKIATKLQRQIHDGYEDEKVRDILSVSIGIAICPDDSNEFEELYKKADKALYVTKKNGKGHYTVYDESFDKE